MSFSGPLNKTDSVSLLPPRYIRTGTEDDDLFYDVYSAQNSLSIPKYSTGAMVANEYKKVLEVKGRGVLNFVSFGSPSGPRVIGLRIIIDGTQVYKATTPSGNDRGIVAIGGLAWSSSTYLAPVFDQIPFNDYFSIEAMSSDTGGGDLAIAYRVV